MKIKEMKQQLVDAINSIPDVPSIYQEREQIVE